jgi:hypothetical protein
MSPVRLGLAAVAASALALAGCVTVVEGPTRGVQVKKGSTKSAPTSARSGSGAPAGTSTGATQGLGALETPAPPMQLPEGQIAQPVTAGVSTSRVQVAVAPIGIIEYDAQTLPVVSPDGRYIAVQQGKAPTWPTILAQDDQIPADGARLAIFEVTDQGLKALPLAPDVPAGLTLGRDANARAFLVESVRPDGSRWIGEISWATGQLSWLITGSDIFAHAAYMPDDAHAGIVCTVRERGGERSVILLVRGGQRRILANEADAAWTFPTPVASPSDGGAIVFAMCVTRAGVEAGAIGIRETGGGILSRRRVAAEGSIELAYQAIASMQPSAWSVGDSVGSSSGDAGASIALVHPDQARVVVFEPRSGTMLPIGKGTVASIRWQHAGASGYFVTGREGLLYLPDAGVQTGQAPARVLGSPFVVRAVRDHRGPSMIGFGPSRRNDRALEVLRVAVGGSPRE